LFPVGRLDRETEGLVLLTNDGALAHVLLHPSFESEREYRVTVRGRIAADTLQRLAGGIMLDDGPTAPATVGAAHYDPSSDTSVFGLTLIEGRKRQIRRALAALRHPVVGLVRVRMGPLELSGDRAQGPAPRAREDLKSPVREPAAGVQFGAEPRSYSLETAAKPIPRLLEKLLCH
jgi:pseudouridine synthase